MIYASKLKKTNICEYLLYMWQLEDVIRAARFDISIIREGVIRNMPVRDEQERMLVEQWYESLIDMMLRENLQEKGHLQINRNVIVDLNDFHVRCLASGQVPSYNAKFYHVLPLIHHFKSKSSVEMDDIEACFTFQYGILLLRLQKKEISPETLKTQGEISKFMILLAKNYHLYQEGRLDLE